MTTTPAPTSPANANSLRSIERGLLVLGGVVLVLSACMNIYFLAETMRVRVQNSNLISAAAQLSALQQVTVNLLSDLNRSAPHDSTIRTVVQRHTEALNSCGIAGEPQQRQTAP